MPVTRPQEADVFGVPLLSPTYSFGLLPANSVSEENSSSESPALKTIAVVSTGGRLYDIRVAPNEDVDGYSCYHLILAPRSNGNRFRLRELWIDRATFVTRKAVVQGNFTAGPAPTLPWAIHFAVVDDRMYISDELSLQPLTYLGRKYSAVEISFQDVQTERTIAPSWLLSTFSTSGDVLQEP